MSKKSDNLKFNSSTDGFLSLLNFSANVTVNQVLSDLQQYNTLRAYLQAYKHKQLCAIPYLIATYNFNDVFCQHVFDWSDVVLSAKHALTSDLINNLLNSLTQDWLDLNMQPADTSDESCESIQPFDTSNESCESIRFVFMPREDKKYIFYDLISKQSNQFL